MMARSLPGYACTFLVFSTFLLLLTACGSRSYRLKNVAKSDIDLVADAHFREADELLRTLMIKLYKRNPREVAKRSGATIKSRLFQVFAPSPMPPSAELGRRRSVAAIDLCFDPAFEGDRVFALVAGLRGMLLEAYGNRREQFLFDSLDEQNLYNSARNIEIVVWRLGNRLGADGKPFLFTNSLPGEEANLSFERLFGKLIAIQDMMARITADRGNRTINRVVHSVASAAFFPIGL